MFWCFEGVCVHPQKLDNSFESCASKSNNLGRPLEIKFGYTSKTRLKSAMNGPWPWHWKFPNILPNITNAIRHETSKIYPSCSIQVSHGKNRSPRFGPNFFKACWRTKKLRPSCSPAVRVLLAQCPFDGFNAATIQELRLREFTQLLQDLAAATRYWLLERSSWWTYGRYMVDISIG